MAKISIDDLGGSAKLDIADDSLAAQHGLSRLHTAASDVITALPRLLLDKPFFKEASFGLTFSLPAIPIKSNTVNIKAGANSSLRISRCADSPLFGKDDCDPVEIPGNDCFVSLELDTTVDAGVKAPLPQGFGVSFEQSTAPKFSTHLHIEGSDASTTSLETALSKAINAFRILDSADAVLNVPPGAIYSFDLAGSVKVGGSWQLPLSVNQLCLADAKLPFNQSIAVNPNVKVKLEGDIKLTSEFSVRVRKVQPGQLHFALYRKKGSTLEAGFTAAAELQANIDKLDLIKTVFTALGSSLDSSALGALTPDEADEVHQILKDGISRSLGIALNSTCSASLNDEALFAYAMDCSSINPAKKDAIAKALHGDWGGFNDPAVARQLRNAVVESNERKTTLSFNFLGLYNAVSIGDFVKSMRLLRNDEDGSITITDKVTAARIAAAITPLAAKEDRLRKALYEGFVATATYKALLAAVGANPAFDAKQSYLVYAERMSFRDALKQLTAGEVLGVMPENVKTALGAVGAPVHHANFRGSRSYSNDEVLRFFFSDVAQFTPHSCSELIRIARFVLADLLDPQDPTDQARIAHLENDQLWLEMASHPASIAEPFSADYLDIVWWAAAIDKTAPLLADTIRYARTLKGDISSDATFMKKRANLASALDNVTHSTHGAFDKAFALSVMSELAGSKSTKGPVFEATWDGKTIFSNKPAEEIAAAAR